MLTDPLTATAVTPDEIPRKNWPGHEAGLSDIAASSWPRTARTISA